MEQRQLKFRAWDIENKEFIEGEHLMSHVNKSIITIAGVSCDNEEEICNEEVIIEQWTGLVDKHGTKAFVGDVVKEIKFNGDEYFYKIFNVKGGFAINTHQDDFMLFTTQISFYESLADMQTSSWFESSVEIIGNIHESSEGVKTKNKL